jgi:hypothetical protein
VARLSGADAWLHVQDFEIDVAFRLGLLKSKRLQASGHRDPRARHGAGSRGLTMRTDDDAGMKGQAATAAAPLPSPDDPVMTVSE